MKDLLDRLSSYNFFNYLLPGALFSIVASKYTSADLLTNNLVVAFFVFYFIGMIVSRIGSLFIEPLLLRVNFITYSEYSKYVTASAKDSKIDVLLEVNNTYRTLISLFVTLGFFKLYDLAATKIKWVDLLGPYLLGFFLLFLFVWSFKKQTKFINSRVDQQQ